MELPARSIGVVRCAVSEGRDKDWGDADGARVDGAAHARLLLA